MDDYFYELKEARIAVMVKRINCNSRKFKIIPESICILKSGCILTELKNANIVDENGEEVKSIGKFLFSAETTDPFHLVVDMY